MSPFTTTITVQRLRDLFVDSVEDNPLISEWEAESGMQRVANALITRPLTSHVRVTVRVPDTLDLTPARIEQVRAAIDRYCDARISENQRTRRFTILTGLISLGYSFVIYLLITLLFFGLLASVTLPTWVMLTADLFYVLAAWALLWGPIESVLFTWLPNYLTIRVYRTIKAGAFVFEAVPMAPPDDLL